MTTTTQHKICASPSSTTARWLIFAFVASVGCGGVADDETVFGADGTLAVEALAGVREDAGMTSDTSLDASALPSAPIIEEVQSAGADCPPGTVDIDIAPNRQSFTARLRRFTLTLDPSTVFRRATCRIAVLVRSPAGQKYTLEGFSGDGAIALDDGVVLTFTRGYRFLGDATNPIVESTTQTTTLSGPRNEPIHIEDRFLGESGRSSSCTYSAENVFVELAASLRNSTPGRSASFTLDHVGDFRFALRPCTSPR